MLGSNPITAEQLAERKRRVCEEMGPNSFVASLTGEQWDHIIACLREHESRAAVDHDAQCDRHWIAGANFGWNMGIDQNSEAYVRGINNRRREIVADAKAAVEKAVRL